MKNSKKIAIFIGEKEEKKLSEKKLKKKWGRNLYTRIVLANLNELYEVDDILY